MFALRSSKSIRPYYGQNPESAKKKKKREKNSEFYGKSVIHCVCRIQESVNFSILLHPFLKLDDDVSSRSSDTKNAPLSGKLHGFRFV